jgi:hypothetical protein
MILKVRNLLIILSLVLTISCGGGGGGDAGVNNDGVTDNQQSNDSLNVGLSGKYFLGCSDGFCTIDADTGTYTVIPNTDYKNQKERYPYAAMTSFIGTTVEHNNDGFLVIADNRHGSKIFMQDYSGNYLWELSSNQELLSGSLSQDLQYIALFTRTGSVSNTPWLKIYTINGEIISEKELNQKQILWLRDNRILYSQGRTFYFTSQVSTEVDYSLTLPDASLGVVRDGYIVNKAISPNESQIAFVVAESAMDLVDGPQNSRLYIMNIDGSDIRLLATTYNDIDPSIIAPSWSPDGRWILVTEGYRPSLVGLDSERFGHMYLVPADDPGKVYYLSTDSTERSQEVRLFRRIDSETNSVTTRGTGSVFPWIPD